MTVELFVSLAAFFWSLVAFLITRDLRRRSLLQEARAQIVSDSLRSMASTAERDALATDQSVGGKWGRSLLLQRAWVYYVAADYVAAVICLEATHSVEDVQRVARLMSETAADLGAA